MGYAGIQADIRTVRDFGCYAVTAVTAVTIQNSSGITGVHQLPTDLVAGQVKAIYEETVPNAVKVGMTDNAETIRAVSQESMGCRNVVCSPVILASHGGLLMSDVFQGAHQCPALRSRVPEVLLLSQHPGLAAPWCRRNPFHSHRGPTGPAGRCPHSRQQRT